MSHQIKELKMAPWATLAISISWPLATSESKPMGFIKTLGVPGAAPRPGPAGTL